jgi:hypothetical protein
VLDILFQLPCRKPMAFKGGTLQFETIVERLQRLEAEINSIGAAQAWRSSGRIWTAADNLNRGA